MRLRERRRCDHADRPPCLRTALRQLRMRVLEARGPVGISAFIERANGVALLANLSKQSQSAHILAALTSMLARGSAADMRETIYAGLDRATGALRN